MPRDVRLAALARAVCAAGDEMAVVALLLHLARASDGRAVAALMLAAALPLLLLAPWAGLLADRLSTRTALVGTGLLQAVAAAALAGAVAVDAGLAVLLALVAIVSAAQAVAGPTWAALVPTLVAPAEVPRAVGFVQSAMTTGLVLAPLVAGVLVGALGPAWPLLLDAVSFLGVVVAAMMLRHPRVPRRDARGDGSAWEGVRVLRHDPVLRPLVLLVTLFVLAVGAVNVVEVLLVTVVLGASPAAYGLVGAVFAVGMLAGQQLAARGHGERGQARLLVIGAAVLVAALLGVAASPTVLVAALCSAVVGVGNGLLGVSGQVLTVARAPQEVRGRVFAATGGAFQAASVVALVVGGALVGVLGVRGVVAAAAAACGLAVAITAPALLRSTRRSPADPVPAAVPA